MSVFNIKKLTSSDFSESLISREELERMQMRLLNEKEHERNNRNRSKEYRPSCNGNSYNDRYRDRSRERNDRWIRDREDRGFKEEQIRVDHSRPSSSQQLMPHTRENGVITVLRHLSILESHLGSLRSKSVGLLSEALHLEKFSQGSADMLVLREEIFFQTLREKLIGLLEVGFLDQTLSRIADIVVQKISTLLSIDKRRTSYDPSVKSKQLLGAQKHKLNIVDTILNGQPLLSSNKKLQNNQNFTKDIKTFTEGSSSVSINSASFSTQKRHESDWGILTAEASRSNTAMKKPYIETSYENGGISSNVVVRDFKMAIVSINFPEILLTQEHSEIIQKIILEEILSYEEENSAPKFHNSYFEKGALLITCVDERSKKWLEDKVPEIKADENTIVKVGLASILLHTTKVLVCIPKSLVNMSSEKILHMIENQNNGLRTQEWTVVSRKVEAQGESLEIVIDSSSLKSLQAVGLKTFLGLSMVTFKIISTPK